MTLATTGEISMGSIYIEFGARTTNTLVDLTTKSTMLYPSSFAPDMNWPPYPLPPYPSSLAGDGNTGPYRIRDYLNGNMSGGLIPELAENSNIPTWDENIGQFPWWDYTPETEQAAYRNWVEQNPPVVKLTDYYGGRQYASVLWPFRYYPTSHWPDWAPVNQSYPNWTLFSNVYELTSTLDQVPEWTNLSTGSNRLTIGPMFVSRMQGEVIQTQFQYLYAEMREPKMVVTHINQYNVRTVLGTFGLWEDVFQTDPAANVTGAMRVGNASGPVTLVVDDLDNGRIEFTSEGIMRRNGSGSDIHTFFELSGVLGDSWAEINVKWETI